MCNCIEIIGAKSNNLKDVDVKIPKGELTVFSGVSGSGKSSLVFDTLYSVGKQQFDELMDNSNFQSSGISKADVRDIKGLIPVVALEQKTYQKNPRSTVGTITRTLQMQQALFALAGEAQCPYCGRKLKQLPIPQIVSELMRLPEGTVVELRSPIKKKYAQNYENLMENIKKKYIGKIYIDGKPYKTSELPSLDNSKEYPIEAVLNSVVVSKALYKQILKSLETIQILTDDNPFIILHIFDDKGQPVTNESFYTQLGCCEHHMILLPLQAYHFSYNTAIGACETCLGLGVDAKAYPDFIVADPHKSIAKGALHKGVYSLVSDSLNGVILYSLSVKYGFSLDTPYEDLPKQIQDILIYGTNGEEVEMINPPNAKKQSYIVGSVRPFEGFVENLERQHRELMFRRTNGDTISNFTFEECLVECECPSCKGDRLKPPFLSITFCGRNIADYMRMPITELKAVFQEILSQEELSEDVRLIAKKFYDRVCVLYDIGLGYLNLGRPMDSVSGGEAQRIKLSSHLQSDLTGLLYIMDEPSVGLHARDVSRLIKNLKKLKEKGNTIVVVEHDLEIMKSADHIIEIGPRAGKGGGQVIAEGTVTEVMNNSQSVISPFMKDASQFAVTREPRKTTDQYLKIVDAHQNNLKHVSVDIPLHMLVCVTGVSGSGKSTLINETLVNFLLSKKYGKRLVPGKHQSIEGTEFLNNVINIDQKPIGTSKSSTVATYIGIFDQIRQIYADLPEYKERGYTAQDFSLVSKKGLRCYNCNGEGIKTIKVRYMPEIESICPVCKGDCYSEEGLKGNYKNKNIASALRMSIDEAYKFFAEHELLRSKLHVMMELGLGYLSLGQKTNTISGGEAQRLKLAFELSKKKGNKDNLYIFDEPSVGLHPLDVERLINYIDRLVTIGNSVIIIEHNLDIIKSADYIIDIGPDGGVDGGRVVAVGTPSQVSLNEKSYTGQYLKPIFKRKN